MKLTTCTWGNKSIYLSVCIKMQTFNQDTVELALSYYRLSVLTCIKMVLKHYYCRSILLRWFQDSFTFTISVRSYNALIWFIFLPCFFFHVLKFSVAWLWNFNIKPGPNHVTNTLRRPKKPHVKYINKGYRRHIKYYIFF